MSPPNAVGTIDTNNPRWLSRAVAAEDANKNSSGVCFAVVVVCVLALLRPFE